MSEGKPPPPPAPRDSGEEFRLAPPEGWSPQELERRSALPRSLPEPDPPPKPRQFSVADMMIVMIGVALGLAGGSWMPTDMFAAVLGLVTLIGLLVVSWHPPESHLARLLWATLVLAYVIAVLAAVFRPDSI